MGKSPESDFGLSTYARWDVDEEAGELVFSDGGVPKVAARIQDVGSFSTNTKTWLWSWANNSVEEARWRDIGKVRAFGEGHSLRELTEPCWPGDVEDGWAMTSVAAYLLKAKAAYRGPVGHLYLFMILMDLRWT